MVTEKKEIIQVVLSLFLQIAVINYLFALLPTRTLSNHLNEDEGQCITDFIFGVMHTSCLCDCSVAFSRFITSRNA